MKKILTICLFAVALSMAQRQRVAVLPTIADPDAKLSARELDILTEKLRGYASDVLPLSDFVLLKQDFVKEKLGDEGFFKACKEGTCVGDLIAKVQADFGARCEVFSVSGKLWLKFELYGTLKGEDEAGTISTFSEGAKDFKAMEVLIENRVPDAFKKILPKPASVAQVPPPTRYTAPVQTAVTAEIVTEPAGAALSLNGMPLHGCPKTPCKVEFYGNQLKISAALDEYETADTTLTITQLNQLVKMKLKQTTYVVNFVSDPSGANLIFNEDINCSETPCRMKFKKGNVKVNASKKLYENLDTTVFISKDNRFFILKLNPNYGILNINPVYSNNIGKGEDWLLTVGGRSASFGETKLLPGGYNVELTHSCYEDIKVDRVKIEKGGRVDLDMSEHLVLKQGTLVLKAERKGRNTSKPVSVNYLPVGETPFKGSIPLCSQIHIYENNRWEKVYVKLERNEPIEYTYKESTKKSHLLGAVLDVAGVFFLLQSMWAWDDRDKYRDDYARLKSGTSSEYNGVWKEAKDAHSKGNTFLIIGGAVIALGIGVHVWF